jgi:hypothetical protein
MECGNCKNSKVDGLGGSCYHLFKTCLSNEDQEGMKWSVYITKPREEYPASICEACLTELRPDLI